MTSSIGFYMKPSVLESVSFKDDDIFDNEDDGEDLDNNGYLHEVPYTSSSFDRTSIGSIPWADDAIKINIMEWEKVERMLIGLEPLPAEEDDLKKEILDWQNKFPQFLNKNKHKKSIPESFDIESLPSLDLTSEDEDYDIEGKLKLTRERNTVVHPAGKTLEGDSINLCQLMDGFTLKSVPLKLNQRKANVVLIKESKSSSSTSSLSSHSPYMPVQQVPSISTSTNRFRMPPILNVLDSRKKFRNLSQNKNHSFVQLTQIQQAKSAAVAQEQTSRSRFHTVHRSAWHVPFVANRFSNNRNSIILPSISNRNHVNQRYRTQPAVLSNNSDIGMLDSTPSSSGTRGNMNNNITHNSATKLNFILGSSFTNASTQTNTSNSSTSGRSISAAVNYPRVTPTFNALYLPYSASKFHKFK